MIDYLPNAPLNSTLIDYELFAAFWMLVPNYVKIRIPQIVFKASEDGFNLRNLYNSVDMYLDSYYSCLILIKTTQNEIFGVFLDVMPQPYSVQHQGGHETFVFGLKPDLCHYPSAQANEFFLLAATDYLSVGAGGKGPALRFDDKLKDGSTF